MSDIEKLIYVKRYGWSYTLEETDRPQMTGVFQSSFALLAHASKNMFN